MMNRIFKLSILLYLLFYSCTEKTAILEDVNLYPVKINNSWGFIDETGILKIDPQYDRVKNFTEGLGAVFTDNKWGYINKSSKIIIKPQFDDALPFSEGLAGVFTDNKWGFINNTGITVINTKYMGVSSFSEGLAHFISEFDLKHGFINTYNKIKKILKQEVA